MKIESGTTSERRTRALITALALLGGGLWFAYDGWIGYPGQNLAEFVDGVKDSLAPDGGTPQPLPAVHEARAKELAAATSVDEIEQSLGGPPTVRTAFDLQWLGPSGKIVVEADSATGRIARPPAFHRFRRSETDILWQKAIGVALLAAFGYAAWRLGKIVSARFVLDDAGLRIPAAGPVSWDAMQRLEADAYIEKGWVDLWYQVDGSPRSVRLDSYEIGAFEHIIDEICRRKGFENPLPVENAPPPASQP